ncbi:MAG: hypothetical protein U5K69_11080 [Balneolaceae bacterium]|nr:hypothetical protein [Balneolaceae bacterium]
MWSNSATALGDIEVDLMMGKAHKSALLVLTDRTTLLTKVLKKVTSRKAAANGPGRIIDQLGRIFHPAFIKTLTFDNDKAFARHQRCCRSSSGCGHLLHPARIPPKIKEPWKTAFG